MVKAFPLNQQEYSYNAQDVSYYYAGRHSGVFALDTNCQVSVVSGMDIKVAKGKGWLAHGVDYGVVFWMEEDVNLTVPVGDVASPRWDYVCVGWETKEVKNNPTIYIKSGSPAVTPTEPTLENTANKIEICLAKIYVPSGTTNLTATGVTLTDTRADKNYCGLVGDDLRTTNLEERATSLENRTTSLEGRATSLENRTTSLEGRVSDSETEINKIKDGTTSAKKATNADNAVKLLNARTINGTSFDGSSNITTQKWGQGRNITIDGISRFVDGGNDINFNTINLYKTTIPSGGTYTFNECKEVGKKYLIDVYNSDTTGNVKVIGNSNVKQLVIYSAKSGSVLSKIIDARDDYWINLPIKDGSGFVFVIGVPN